MEENKKVIIYVLVLALVMFTLGCLTVELKNRPLKAQIIELSNN